MTEGSLKDQLMSSGTSRIESSTGAMILVRFATLWFAVLVGFVSLSLMKRRYPGLLGKEKDAAKVHTGGAAAEEPPA